MVNGLVGPTEERVRRKASSFSAPIQQLVLDDLDKELTRRGHKFVRLR